MEMGSESIWKGTERMGDWWKRSTTPAATTGADESKNGVTLEVEEQGEKEIQKDTSLILDGPPASKVLLAGVDQAKNLASNFSSFIKQRVSTTTTPVSTSTLAKDSTVEDVVKPALLSATLSSFFSRPSVSPPTPSPAPASISPLPSPSITPTTSTWNTFDRFRRSISSSNPASPTSPPTSSNSPLPSLPLPSLPVLPPLLPRAYSPVQKRRNTPVEREEETEEAGPIDLDARFEAEEEERRLTPVLLSPPLPATPTEPEYPSFAPSPFIPFSSPILSKSKSKEDIDEEQKEENVKRLEEEDDSDDEIGLGVSSRNWREESEEREARDEEEVGMKEVEL